MPAVSRQRNKVYPPVIGAAVLFILLITGLLVVRQRGDAGLGLRSLPRTAWNILQAVIQRGDVVRESRGQYTNIIFLHHSTGDNLIEQGHARDLFTAAGYSFWDQGYNDMGLRDPDGNFTGYGYNVPGDNTDPDGLAGIFSQPVVKLPLNTFSALLQHEVIIFKSCFAPTSKITSDEQLEQDKQWYLTIRDSVDKHPDKLFILLTQPPLNPAETNPAEAVRARQLADWLTSDVFLQGRKNFYVIDLFNMLADDNSGEADFNMLRASYRNGNDSHPNKLANQEIAPLFVERVMRVINSYRTKQLNLTPNS